MSKIRLTITISPEIILELDRLIDGQVIRNRSHAIESLVNRQLMGEVSQAVILTGGNPDALRYTTTLIAGRPLISHLINLIRSYGIHQIYILTDQAVKSLTAIVNDPKVTIIHQAKKLGTAGALRDCGIHFSASPLLVLHGDIFTDINLIDLIRFHHDHGKDITLCVKPKLNHREFGKVIMNGHQVTKFLSKPDKSEVGMINTGVYLINPSILRHLPRKATLMLETDVFPKLAEDRKLTGFLFEGIWYDIPKNKK